MEKFRGPVIKWKTVMDHADRSAGHPENCSQQRPPKSLVQSAPEPAGERFSAGHKACEWQIRYEVEMSIFLTRKNAPTNRKPVER